MSQIWTIDTNKLTVLSTSSLAETEVTGVFTYTTTSETFAFTKIRKQASDTDNLDLFVYDAWVQISLMNIATRGGTLSFESSAIGQTVRTWLKLFANFTSTTINNLTGYTWIGDANLSIAAGISNHAYLQGTAIGRSIQYMSIGNAAQVGEADVIYVTCIEAGTSSYIPLYERGAWVSEEARTVHISGGTDVTKQSFINFILQYGDLVAPAVMIQVDLATLSLPSGRHIIQMRLSDDGETHANSDLSATNVYYDVPFNITFNLTNVTQTSGGTTINPDATATYVFTTATGYALPNAVTVTGATSSWDQATGTLMLTKGADADPVEVTISATLMPKLNACSAEFDTDDVSVVIITPDDGNGAATQFAMYDNGATTGVVIQRQA